MWINDIDADGTEHPRDTGCPSCSSAADGIGNLRQLHVRNTTLVAVTRAPYEKIAAFRERMGWTFPWYSSAGSDFNYDFHATVDNRVAPVQIFHRTEAELAEAGMPFTESMRGDWPGISAFLRVGDEVFHTYSTFGRRIEEFHNGYRSTSPRSAARRRGRSRRDARSHSACKSAAPPCASPTNTTPDMWPRSPISPTDEVRRCRRAPRRVDPVVRRRYKTPQGGGRGSR